MKTARKVTRAITIIAGILLVLSISGYDSGNTANTFLIVVSSVWLMTVLFINYRELVRKYG